MDEMEIVEGLREEERRGGKEVRGKDTRFHAGTSLVFPLPPSELSIHSGLELEIKVLSCARFV